MGLALASFQGVALTAISSAIQYGMYTGTLEAMLVTPTSLSTIVFASVLYQFFSALFSLLLYIPFGVVLFGVSLGKANLLSAVVMLGLALLLAHLPIGIFSAGFLLVFKGATLYAPGGEPVGAPGGACIFPWPCSRLAAVRVLLPAFHPRPGRVAPGCPQRSVPAGLSTQIAILGTFAVVLLPLTSPSSPMPSARPSVSAPCRNFSGPARDQ